MKRKLAEQLPARKYTLNSSETKKIRAHLNHRHNAHDTDVAFFDIYTADLDGLYVIVDIYIVSCMETAEHLETERIPGFRWVCDGKTAGTIKLTSDRKWSDADIQRNIRGDNSYWYGSLCNHVLFVHTTQKAEQALKTWGAEHNVYINDKTTLTQIIERLYNDIKRGKAGRKRDQERYREQCRQQELENLGQISEWTNRKLPQYLFYIQKRNTGIAFCTACRKNWEYRKTAGYWYRMNGMHQCPHCGSVATAKPVGRYQDIQDKVDVVYIQRTETGIAIRFEQAHRNTGWFYTDNRGYVTIRYTPIRIYYLHEQEKLKDRRRKMMQKISYGAVIPGKNGIWLYTGNLKQATEGTIWKYMDLSILQKNLEIKKDGIAYLCNLLRKPGYEALYKCGFWNLLWQATWQEKEDPLHPEQRELHRVLGITRQQLYRIRNTMPVKDITINIVRIMRHEQEYGQLTPEQLRSIRNIQADEFLSIAKYTKRYGRTINYLCKHKNKIRTWLDYLQMAEKTGRDMRDDIVLYPKKLEEMHDRLAKERNQQKTYEEGIKADQEYAHIAEIEKKVNRIYGYEGKDLFIRAPHAAHEIVYEGKNMHHCVYANGYHRRMNDEKTFILFLRKKETPEIPFYTLEVKPNGTLAQCRGAYNRLPEWDTISLFVEEYKRKIKNKRWR